MILDTLDLKKEYALEYSAKLDLYLHEEHADVRQRVRPAVIVAPGGAYAFVSGRENEEVALEFFTRDYNAFALNYTVAPEGYYPAQLTELACAVDYVKKHAPELYVDPERIYLVGFSAGGHLVGSLANARSVPGMPELDFRPAGIVLSYAVVTERVGGVDSFRNLLGETAYAEKRPEHAWLNLDESVTDRNPPAFIWTTADDACVPVMNSLLYASAYARLGLKFELHVFRSGPHGLSVCDRRTSNGEATMENADAAIWPEYADRFLRSLKG